MHLCWLILVAVLSQTTQPSVSADQRIPAQRATQGFSIRPVGAPIRVTGPATQPATGNRAPRMSVAANDAADRGLAPRMSVAAPATQPVRIPPSSVTPVPGEPGVVQMTVPPATQPAPGLPAAAAAALGTATQPAAQAETLEEIARLSGADVNIEVTRDGKLIITGLPEDIEILRRIIAELDRQLIPPFDIQVFKLEGAHADHIARQLSEFWRQARQTATGQQLPEDRITVMGEPRSNTLIVAASPENMPQVSDIIKRLDLPPAAWDVTAIPLTHIRAEEAASMLTDLLKSRQQRQGQASTPIDIRPDPRTNSLLISASKPDLEQIRQLVQLLDVEPGPRVAAGGIKMAWFPLEKAVATDLATILEQMLKTEGGAKAIGEQIRRLQLVMRAKGEKKELEPVDLEKPIKIIADKGTNSILVASVEQNLDPIGEIIKLLDSVPLGDQIIVKIYPLEHADAETTLTNLQRMFEQGKTLPEQPGQAGKVPGRIPQDLPGAALAYPIGLASDKRTNALVVSGRPEQIVLVEQVVRAIDVPEDANKFPPRLVMLEHADARRLAEALTKVADQRQKMAEKLGPTAAAREQITVISDARSNSLIIIAKDDNFQELSELAKKLDGVSPEYLGQIRIINLENLMASELATKIKDLWTGRSKLRREGELPEDQPVIVTDTRSNSLIVASNREDFEMIEKLVKELEQQKVSPMAEIRPLIVRNHDVAKLGEMLRRLFEERRKMALTRGEEELPSERVAIVEDPFTRTLLIASNKANYDEIVRLMTQLDIEPPVEGLVRTFPIRNTDVQRAADMLNDIFTKGIVRPAASTKDLPESLTKVTIVPDIRSSSLLVSASPENIAVIETLLKEIDRAETPPFAAEARVFRLEHADAVRVADMLGQLFKGMQATMKDQTALNVQIVPNIRSNTVLVSGSRFAVKRAEELIPMLDTAPGTPTAVVQVYSLQQASAVQLAQSLSELFEKRAADQGAKATPITVLADQTSNSLIVTASREDQIVVQELINRLDVRSTIAQQMEIIPLREARAEPLADNLTKILQQQQRGQQGPSFAITAEPRTNSLIVYAPPDLMSNIRTIVQRLDTTKPTAEMALRVFELHNAKAEDLAKRLDEFFKAAGTTEGRDARQMIINFTPINPATGRPIINPDTGAALVQRLVHQDITITPDPQTNSLLVLAPEGSIDMMQMLIEMLDSVKPVTAEIAVFPLLNADAAEMKQLLDDLFGTTGGGAGAGATRRELTIAGAEAAPVTPGVTPGPQTEGAPVEISFAVDERTNSLIAAGSPAYLKIVESLIVKLDYKDIEERIVRVVHLRNAQAEDVAEAMSSYFQEEAQLIERAAGEEAATRQLQRQVTIQDGGEDTNALLLSYSPRMESKVIDMINELDQPPPQVMIQVLMAEVTLDDRFEMGMEFALQDLTFSENAFAGPNGVIQGSGFDHIFGTDLGAAGTGGGISFTVTGEDFNFLFRALQTEGRLEVLSRPAIMVRDNQEANITVGERVPTVQDITVSAAGVVTPSVTYEEVGIILTVTPIINPDGFVNLEIEPEISAIGTSSITVASGVTLPTFTQRKASTSVTVKDGETIIIGGLITNRENTSENKVPIFGDIPILGNAFRSTVRATTKTELLIVLTPHVISDPAQAHTISEVMRDQTGLNENIRQNPLMQGLQVTPEQGLMGPGCEQPATRPGEAPEELGPELEEFGPQAQTIDLTPARSLAELRTAAK